MSGTVEFFEPMRVPTTTHNELEPHVDGRGRMGIHKSAALARAEAVWEAHLGPHAPGEPLDGPLMLSVIVCRPLESAPGGTRQGDPCAVPPDLDNWAKTIQDAMARCGFFRDDAQVVDLHMRKVWSDPQGVWVRLGRVPTPGAS